MKRVVTENNEASLDRLDTLGYTADIVAAYVSKNPVSTQELPDLIAAVHERIEALGKGDPGAAAKQEPAVPIKKSVTDDYLICLEDGRKLKMLKRHLSATYGMTPDQYRAKWGLPSDYPMVAPNYAKKRQRLAKEIGLGRKRAS
ncbi:MucR family transcriptional regulator [Paracoccaceae bacterium GXU_MW_L88]